MKILMPIILAAVSAVAQATPPGNPNMLSQDASSQDSMSDLEEGEDAQLLMLAAHAGFMRAVVDRCEPLISGYKSRFQDLYPRAEKNFLAPAGIDGRLFHASQKNPELSVQDMVSAFDRSPEDKRLMTCQMHLRDMSSMTTMQLPQD